MIIDRGRNIPNRVIPLGSNIRMPDIEQLSLVPMLESIFAQIDQMRGQPLEDRHEPAKSH